MLKWAQPQGLSSIYGYAKEWTRRGTSSSEDPYKSLQFPPKTHPWDHKLLLLVLPQTPCTWPWVVYIGYFISCVFCGFYKPHI